MRIAVPIDEDKSTIVKRSSESLSLRLMPYIQIKSHFLKKLFIKDEIASASFVR